MLRITLILATALLAFPLSAWLSSGGPRAVRSQDHYMMAIADAQQTRMDLGTDAPIRFVLIGGSSLGWSVSAETLTDRLGVPTINLGIHGGLGYRAALEIYRDRLDPDRDVLVVSPEYELIRIRDRNTSPYCDYLFVDRQFRLASSICGLKNLQSRLVDTLQSALGVERRDPVYNRSGFNEHGDYTLHYDLPAKPLDHPAPELSITQDADLIAGYLAFLEGLKAEGFRLIYLPVIMAEQGCRSDAATLYALHRTLSAPAWSDFGPDYPFCLPDTDFFNTGYHMRGPAMREKTDLFSRSISSWMQQSGASTAE